MGIVYEATHAALNKRVAIKTLRAGHAAEQNSVARFMREGKAAARLRHPHVVDVSDVGIEDGIPFLVMEFLDGEDLATYLERQGAISLEKTTAILLPVISAVSAAHAHGIIHRDLKPSNIFLTTGPNGTLHPKLVDFGISKVPRLEDFDGSSTNSSALLGTASHMAPEQTLGAKLVTAQTDQYALGVILYECATGAEPFAAFQDGGIYPLLNAIVEGNFPSPRSVRSDLSAEFEAVVLRAMHRKPEGRFDVVDDLANALLPFASDVTRAVWSPAFPSAAPTERTSLPSPVMNGSASEPEIPSTASQHAPSASASSATSRMRATWVGSLAIVGVTAVLVASITFVRSASRVSRPVREAQTVHPAQSPAVVSSLPLGTARLDRAPDVHAPESVATDEPPHAAARAPARVLVGVPRSRSTTNLAASAHRANVREPNQDRARPVVRGDNGAPILDQP
jgi:serine/threonine-protein kinase